MNKYTLHTLMKNLAAMRSCDEGYETLTHLWTELGCPDEISITADTLERFYVMQGVSIDDLVDLDMDDNLLCDILDTLPQITEDYYTDLSGSLSDDNYKIEDRWFNYVLQYLPTDCARQSRFRRMSLTDEQIAAYMGSNKRTPYTVIMITKSCDYVVDNMEDELLQLLTDRRGTLKSLEKGGIFIVPAIDLLRRKGYSPAQIFALTGIIVTKVTREFIQDLLSLAENDDSLLKLISQERAFDELTFTLARDVSLGLSSMSEVKAVTLDDTESYPTVASDSVLIKPGLYSSRLQHPERFLANIHTINVENLPPLDTLDSNTTYLLTYLYTNCLGGAVEQRVVTAWAKAARDIAPVVADVAPAGLTVDGCIEGTFEGMLAIHRPTHDIFSGRGILSKRTT